MAFPTQCRQVDQGERLAPLADRPHVVDFEIDRRPRTCTASRPGRAPGAAPATRPPRGAAPRDYATWIRTRAGPRRRDQAPAASTAAAATSSRPIRVLQPMSLPPSSALTATGWSDSCRAGFAPAEEWRLRTAHQLVQPGGYRALRGNLHESSDRVREPHLPRRPAVRAQDVRARDDSSYALGPACCDVKAVETVQELHPARGFGN